MHKLDELYCEAKASEAGDLVYLVAAYVDKERNPLYMIPSIIKLAICKNGVIIAKEWLFQPVRSGDCAVIRKAIELFDQYVATSEAHSKEAKDV